MAAVVRGRTHLVHYDVPPTGWVPGWLARAAPRQDKILPARELNGSTRIATSPVTGGVYPAANEGTGRRCLLLHLHCHTDNSLLDGACDIDRLMTGDVEQGMPRWR